MRATKGWIGEYAALPAGLTGRELAEALVRAGLEVERVESIGGDITGPLVIGRAVDFVEEPQKNGKTIRWCHVDVGPELAPDAAPGPLRSGETVSALVSEAGEYWPRGVICGALNFAAGDHVVVALPGTTLPGGFEIGSRKTYGHVSDGMICAEDELGIGEDHSGIIVLPATTDAGEPWALGAPALAAMGVVDEVLDMPITSDMGYCLSVRGLAREAAQALGVGFTDPITQVTPAASQGGYPIRLESDACPLFVALTVEGVDPSVPSPAWMKQRLAACGMRSISLAVDISNYVMLETGQPNHCYDADALAGPIVVRRAEAGETLVTLDGATRTLDPEDLLITDGTGAIGLAGVMGGENTELRDTTTRIVVEAAHFDPIAIARTSRRHKLLSEASRRFERYVDPAAAYGAARRVVDLLVALGGGTLVAETVAGGVPAMPTQTIAADLPERILGMPAPADRVVDILTASGVTVEREGETLTLTPPTWRGDLVDPYDYVEEVGIKIGYDQLPSVVPTAPAGRGYTREQQLRRALTRAIATAGFVEVLTFPWVAETDADALGLPADDRRRRAVRLANPLADTAPVLRTSILPGLFGALARNASRGVEDVALFEAGRVYFDVGDEPTPLPGVAVRPSDAELAAIEATLPDQPRHLAAVVTGDWLPAGWNAPAQPAGWQQVFGLSDIVGNTVGVDLTRAAASVMPWHPGRCAGLIVGGVVVGHAGELHPSVVKAFGLPARTAALELDLDLLLSRAGEAGEVASLSTHPVVKEDVALVVEAGVPAADLQAALAAGAGELLESVRLFDVYTGQPVPEGKKSVAFALRFRAADRTLTDAEVASARDAAVARAASDWGAELRA
ncbi:phenylalanine--tRNA ligase subunit beta [Propioniciclava sp.]|uniref:phenylalanine--tRNA ligase subunit beta n=1 Tax=Propioniciclava sp. TaxID=2038686 RepID=UPI00260DB17E|nr:phenylalanine--tRNA ligase subunit beta [Propioniciclava sp.]